MDVYKDKYLKYKSKYIDLKNQIGGGYMFTKGETIYYKILTEYIEEPQIIGKVELVSVDNKNDNDVVGSHLKSFIPDFNTGTAQINTLDNKVYIIQNLANHDTNIKSRICINVGMDMCDYQWGYSHVFDQASK